MHRHVRIYAYGIMIAVLVGMWICWLARRDVKRARIPVLAPIAALLALTFMSSCGGGGGNGNPYHNPPTPSGTYTLTITGTSSGVSRTIALTLIVQ